MSNPIVTFEPSEILTFKKTDNEGGLEPAQVQDVLKITNLSQEQDVLFRVQTTSPLTYRVKPSNGRIAVGESVSIQVVMIAESTKQDKFLIKYVPIPPQTSQSSNFIDLFKAFESSAQEHRLKCSVLQADGSPIAYGNPSPVQNDAASMVSVTSGIEEKETVVAPVAAAAVAAGVASQASSAAPLEKASEPATATASPAKPTVTVSSSSVDPKDAKIQALTSRNAELAKQVEDLQKALTKANASPAGQVPPEWIALLNSQTGFPPVLVILIALFSFLVGLLF